MQDLVTVLVHNPIENGLSNALQSISLSVNPDPAIVLKHVPRNVSSKAHDYQIGRLRFGHLCDAGYPQIMKAALDAS